ncbi:MAG: hypothetical protein H7239_04910 [Flavobacterium sp.]|nr:hypothetical protein [Flavobacterium sp.]
MRNLIVYLTLILCLFATKVVGQETFEARAKAIADKIETITTNEKQALKIEVDGVNFEVEKGTITKDQADLKKQEFAKIRAANIETKVASLQEELKNLVQEKVDGKLAENKDKKVTFSWKSFKDTISKSEKRTTSQFVFAAGVNNLVTDGKVSNSDFRYWGSHFYEWGLTYNTRILKTNNLLHFKYGLSVMYNNLRPTDNRVFVKSGDETLLQVSPIHLDDSRMRNVFLVAPLHLEFDFSKNKTKDGKSFFQSHQSVRVGLGGYAGFRIKSKQFEIFDNGQNQDVTVKTKGDFNVNDFIYGVSGYVGFKEASIYVKYDLNPMFQNNVIKQNNISLGIRFDLN